MASVDETIEEIIAREGGDVFTDRPEDRGGPTRFGITLPALTDWLGREATVQDLKTLTHRDAHEVYRELYIRRPGFGFIGSQSLLALIADMAVNHGVSNTVMLLQRAVGVKDDGVFGPITRQAVAEADFAGLYRNLIAERVKFRGAIITNDYKRLLAKGTLKPEDKCQAANAHGWANRDAEFIERA